MRTSHAREAVSESPKCVIPPRERPWALALWRVSPLFMRRDEGDGRNDARVAHARPIVAKSPVELPCDQMLPRRRDRAGTRTWRSMGVGRSSALPAPPAARLKSVGRFREKSGCNAGQTTSYSSRELERELNRQHEQKLAKKRDEQVGKKTSLRVL